MLWSIIVGGFIGLITGGITKKGGSMGIIANIFAGLVGSFVGQSLFGAWGPSLAGMALIPSNLRSSHCCCSSIIFPREKRMNLNLFDRNRLKFKFCWWKDSICQKPKKYFTLFYVF